MLRDEQGKSLLNGDNVIIPFHNVSFYAGVAYEYNGSGSPIERVNTTYTRKLKRDLIVEVINIYKFYINCLFKLYTYIFLTFILFLDNFYDNKFAKR